MNTWISTMEESLRRRTFISPSIAAVWLTRVLRHSYGRAPVVSPATYDHSLKLVPVWNKDRSIVDHERAQLGLCDPRGCDPGPALASYATTPSPKTGRRVSALSSPHALCPAGTRFGVSSLLQLKPCSARIAPAKPTRCSISAARHYRRSCPRCGRQDPPSPLSSKYSSASLARPRCARGTMAARCRKGRCDCCTVGVGAPSMALRFRGGDIELAFSRPRRVQGRQALDIVARGRSVWPSRYLD